MFLVKQDQEVLLLYKIPLLLPVPLGMQGKQREPEIHIAAFPDLILAYLSLGSKNFKLVNVVFNNIFEV